MNKLHVNSEVKNTAIMVSIICIVYNQKQYIRECLDSFLMQKTNFKIEIVIHDDASTDGTAEIIREYEEKYPDLIKAIYQQENQFSQGVNMWVSVPPHASGKYLAMCEGDDYWINPLMLQKEVDFLESNPEYGLVCGVANVYDEEKKQFVTKHGVKESETYETIVQGVNDIVTSTTLMKSQLLSQCVEDCRSLIDRTLFIDTAMWYWFAYNSKIKFINEVFSVYRVLPESLSHTKNQNKRLNLDMDFLRLKIHFTLSHPIKNQIYSDIIADSFFEEQSAIVNYARYVGKLEVMNSMSYKIGKLILSPFKIFSK